jgi:outer membrane protein assembly factor BamB
MLRSLLMGLLAAACVGAAQAAVGQTGGPKIAWSTALNVPVFSPPQALNGRLYLTSMQPTGPNLFALDGASGKPSWSFSTQGMIGIPPTVGKSQVFVASDIGNTHYLRAIDAKTGDLIWQYTRDQPPECMCSQASILSGGLLFAQSDGHSLYAFAPSGAAPSKRLWQFPGNGAPLTSPVVADGLVVFGSGDHNVYALDVKTGTVRWTGSTGYVFTADPLISNGVVVIGDQGGNIDGFDLKTGKSLWNFAAGTIDVAAISAGNLVVLVSEDHSIYGLNIATGAQVWQYTMDDYAEFSPIAAENLVVAANRAGQLVAVNAKTGVLAWQTDLNGTPFSQPVFWPSENALVLKIGDHAVGAFDAASGKSLWLFNTPLVVTAPVVDGKDVDVVMSSGKVIALN